MHRRCANTLRSIRQGLTVLSFAGLLACGPSPGVDSSWPGPSTGADPLATCVRIQIELRPDAVCRLMARPRRDVDATVRMAGETFDGAGVHLKGSRGSFREINDKPGFTISFPESNSSGGFAGLRKIHLNNGVEDPTFLKEQLAGELFAAAGIPTPRVGHALVELNGRSLGLYVLKEGLTREFLERHFPPGGGHLYDTEWGHDVDQPMKRRLDAALAPHQEDLRRLAEIAREPDLRERWLRLQQVLDLPRFITFMAMEVMICHWDGYCLGQNNFRIYHPQATGRLVFLPTGMDQIFSKPDFPWQLDMSGLVARSILEIPQGRQQYTEQLTRWAGTLLRPGALRTRLDRRLDALRPFLPGREWRVLREEINELGSRIEARSDYLQEQLARPDALELATN